MIVLIKFYAKECKKFAKIWLWIFKNPVIVEAEKDIQPNF